tara:strand:- start:1117 stop:1956 length:840 start_codon:yes stop_codon:yes gene_type:complete
MIENIVFSSGGIMGPGFIGAYKYICENNLHLNIKNLIGCSVGSLIALSISLGYSCKEIEGIVIGLDWGKMVNKNNNILDIIDNYGFDNGSYLIKIVKVLLKKKTNNCDLTFKEHYNLFKKKLIVVGCNINENKEEYFNYKTEPNMKIWEAIRISCGIPLVFTPYKYKKCLYVDGSLNNPCPCNYFKDQSKTINFILESNTNEKNNCDDFKSYLTNLIFYNLRSNKNKRKKKENSITIIIKNGDIQGGFDLSRETKKDFIDIGYNTTKELLPKIIENMKI